MDDARALGEVQKGSEEALRWLVDRYAPYVAAVVGGVIGTRMSAADVEEASADVFVALWKHAGNIRGASSLKPWLGSVARNMARNKLREAGRELPLEEDMLLVSGDAPETEAERREERRLVYRAVLSMGQPDREIFLRHYYYCQPVAEIAAALDMNPATVKTRLFRGREKLRNVLAKEVLDEGGVPDAVCKNF